MTEGAKRVEPEKNRGGVWVKFGDEEYKVPALGFGALRDLQDNVGKLVGVQNGRPSEEQMNAVIDIVHAALKRNYPSLNRQDVDDMLDIENFQPILEAVLKVSLSARPQSGEAQASSQ